MIKWQYLSEAGCAFDTGDICVFDGLAFIHRHPGVCRIIGNRLWFGSVVKIEVLTGHLSEFPGARQMIPVSSLSGPYPSFEKAKRALMVRKL